MSNVMMRMEEVLMAVRVPVRSRLAGLAIKTLTAQFLRARSSSRTAPLSVGTVLSHLTKLVTMAI